jgi:hypothetical protein
MSALVNGLLWNVFFFNAGMGVALLQLYAYLKANPWRVTYWAERLRRFLAR